MPSSPSLERQSPQGGSSGSHSAQRQSASIPQMLAPTAVSGVQQGDPAAGPGGVFASRATTLAMVSIWGCAIVASTWIPVREMWPGLARMERKSVSPSKAQPMESDKPNTHSDGGVPHGESRQAGGTDKPKTPASGELRITSEPIAKIFIDRKAYGVTPTSVKLSDGPHKLLLMADGYQLLHKDITSSEPLALKLSRAQLPEEVTGPAVVSLECKTTDTLRILVDGHDTGQACPTDELRLSVGNHTFSFLDPVSGEQNEKQLKVKKSKSTVKLKVKF